MARYLAVSASVTVEISANSAEEAAKLASAFPLPKGERFIIKAAPVGKKEA